MIEKVHPSKDKKIELLTMALKDIFGYNTEISMDKREYEVNQIKIKDVDFIDDLMTILNRLREDFYVQIEAEHYTEECKVKGKRKPVIEHFARTDIILYRKE